MFEDILDVKEDDTTDFEVNTKIICSKCGVTIIEVVINEDPHVDVRDYEFDCRQCSEGE
jgi:transcription initiation factor TFIIIB Brf1 subunit/transcription initiation factor TFIIB